VSVVATPILDGSNLLCDGAEPTAADVEVREPDFDDMLRRCHEQEQDTVHERRVRDGELRGIEVPRCARVPNTLAS